MCILKWGKFIQCPVLLFFPTPPSPTAYWACSSPPPLLSPCTIWNRKESDTPCFHHRDYENSSTWCVESLQFGQQTTFAQQASTLRFVPLLQEMTFFLLDVVDVDHHWFSAFSHHFFCCSNRLYTKATNFSSNSTILHTVNVCECSTYDNHYFPNMLLVLSLVAQWLCWLRPKPLWHISAVPFIKKCLIIECTSNNERCCCSDAAVVQFKLHYERWRVKRRRQSVPKGSLRVNNGTKTPNWSLFIVP